MSEHDKADADVSRAGPSRRQVITWGALASVGAITTQFAAPGAASAATGGAGAPFPESGPSVDPRMRAAVVSTSSWGGYENGRIPVSVLTRVPANTGQPYLRPDAAIAYQDLSAAYAKRFGSPLGIEEAYRDFATQQDYWDKYQAGTGNLAAEPGTSVHGWALACDFNGGVNIAGSPQKVWMNANAPGYGWQPRGDGFSQVEPWHFEYDGSYDPGTGSGDNDEEDDMIRLTHVPSTTSGAADEYVVIDHGQHTYWIVPSSQLALLRAQGIKEITDRQGRQIISGYRKLT
jgi:hypothetical protein